jgi:hypothetical protein
MKKKRICECIGGIVLASKNEKTEEKCLEVICPNVCYKARQGKEYSKLK